MNLKTMYPAAISSFLLVCMFLFSSGCKSDSPTSVQDELNGYTKVNTSDTLRVLPDKFYFESYFMYEYVSNSYNEAPTLIPSETAVWEYRATHTSEGQDLLTITGISGGTDYNYNVLNNNGNTSHVFTIGLTRGRVYDLMVQNNGGKKVTSYFMFKRTNLPYSQAQYQL